MNRGAPRAEGRGMLLALTVAGLLALSPGEAPAQEAGRPSFEPVTPGVDSAGAGADPDRVLPTDLRQDTGFERVYRVKTTDGRELYARIDGGLIAFFPRGEYASTAGGARPVVPAGTVFAIGRPTEALAGRLGIDLSVGPGSSVRTPAEGPIDRRVDTSARVERPSAAVLTPAARPERAGADEQARGAASGERASEAATPWGDERARAARMAELLTRAAEASAAG